MKNFKFDFIKYRFVFFAISLVIIIIGIIFACTGGFRYDIDFKGGTNIQVDLKQQFDNVEIEKLIENTIKIKPLVQKVGVEQTIVSITTDVISNEQVTQVVDAIKAKYEGIEEPTTRNVQPAFGAELVNSALLAVGMSMIFILIYIFIRFRMLGMSAAVTAIIGLLHDCLIMFTLYAVFSIPINSIFIAAILTVIGYSINDTIIIYDRIRENKKKMAKADLGEVINSGINQTMKRSINTTLTTVVCVIIVYILATIYSQQVLKDFSLPLIIGIISGAYSSVCISAPLWYQFKKLFENKKTDKIKI